MSDYETRRGAESKGETKHSAQLEAEIFTAVPANLSQLPMLAPWVRESKGVGPSDGKVWEYTVGDMHGNMAQLLFTDCGRENLLSNITC